MSAIPWTYAARPDTRTTNVRMGVWLFLASEAMFFGSLFSAYVLLRTGAASWPAAGDLLDLEPALLDTALLIGAGALLASAKGKTLAEGAAFSRGKLYVSAALGAVFLAVKVFEYQSKVADGLHPATNTLLACWFALTAVHAAHVAGGVGINVWLALRMPRMVPAQAAERLHAASLYWFFVDVVWVAILIAFYFA